MDTCTYCRTSDGPFVHLRHDLTVCHRCVCERYGAAATVLGVDPCVTLGHDDEVARVGYEKAWLCRRCQRVERTGIMLWPVGRHRA
jgi:hypothetical protein